MATQLAPNVYVSDVERSSLFYMALGFAELDRKSLPDGTPVWAMLQREGQRIFIARAEPGQKLEASVLFYLAVDDLGHEVKRLDKARIEHSPPELKPYGMKEISWKDPDGYEWSAGQRATPR
jgi:uncharacterized glyoxalase superfamily protein PhnB